jgi:hypothetical protein
MPIVHSHYHNYRALLITLTVEVSCLPTVTRGVIKDFASKVTSKALFDRFDEELELCLIREQCCFFERHPRFLFLTLFFYHLRFFLSSLFFLSLLFKSFSLLLHPLLLFFFLQDCLKSFLQLRDFLMSFLDLPYSHLEQIFLWLLMLLEGMFKSLHDVVDLMS